VQAWKELGPTFTAERFFELEEEVVLLLLSGALTILPEGMPSVTDDVRENQWLTPDKRFYLEMKNDPSPEEAELIREWIESLYATDFLYAGSMMAYAAMLVREEVREMGLRWRQARLTDEGFMEPAEAQQQLAWKSEKQFQQLAAEAQQVEFKKRPFLSAWALGGNTGQEDAHDVIADVLRQQYPGQDDEDFEALIPDLSYRITQWRCEDAKEKSLVSLPGHTPLLLDTLVAQFAADEEYVILQRRLGTLTNIILSGTTTAGSIAHTTFSNDSLKLALSVVRGAVNIGLETCVQQPQNYNLPAMVQAKEVWTLLGPEFLFQVGWRCILNLARIITQEEATGGQDNVLSSEQYIIAQSVHLPLPQYPLMVDGWKQNDPASVKLSQNKRPFERLEELERVHHFWEQVPRL
jgi:hypothetical protein